MSRVRDWEARATIRGQNDGKTPMSSDPYLDVEYNIIVRAGAGSGKTTALVERVLAHLRMGEEPSSIVAITFTRKAAAELRGRIHEAVDAAVNTIAVAGEQERLSQARRRLDEMHVGTIHGFCAGIVRQYADVVGLPPDFRQMEEEEEEVMRNRFWSGFIMQQDESPELEFLREAGVDRSSLVDLFGRLVENADLNVVREERRDVDFSPAVEAARQVMADLGPIGHKGDNEDAVQSRLRKARFMERMRPSMSLGQTAEWLRLFCDMIDTRVGRLRMTMNRWDRPQKFMKAVRDGVEDDVAPWWVLSRIQNQIVPLVAAWDAQVHGRAMALVQDAVDDYAAFRRAEGRLTISDPIHILNDLLYTSADVRNELQGTLRRILIDEFQDTDPVQASLLFNLAADAVDEHDWTRNRLLPGRLLLVGDDKQSIYRFRRADFEVFSRSEKAIVSQGGRSLVLTTNFRSSEPICRWINKALAPLFQPAETGRRHEQAPWEPLEPYDAAAKEPRRTQAAPSVKAIWLNSTMRAEDSAVAEARVIAHTIREHLAEGRYEKPSDFMILFRRNKYVADYVAEITAAGLPVRVSGGKVSGGSDVLPAVCNILESLLREGDEAAGIAALRTPFFGVSDADLYAWRMNGGRFDTLAGDLSGSGPDVDPGASKHSVAVASATLARIYHRFQSLSPWEALRVTADTEGWWDLLRFRSSAAIDTGVLQKILALFAAAEERNLDWVEATEELLRYRDGDVPMKLHAADGDDGVQMLTVHQAKGLEAPCVYLADAGYPGAPRVHTHSFTRDGLAFIALALRSPSAFGSPQVTFTPSDWTGAVEKEKAFSLAEHERLLYVACTRAARELVVTVRDAPQAGHWGDLVPALADVPVLARLDQVPDRISIPGEESGPDVKGRGVTYWHDERRRGLLRMRQAVGNASVPTHELVRPSDKEEVEAAVDSVDELVPPPLAIGMEGREFGQAVHLGMERLVTNAADVRTADLHEIAVSSLRAAMGTEPSGTSVTAVVDALSGFMRGSLWQRVLEADEVLSEVSFTTSLPGSPVRIVSGTVDLALRDQDAWVIVDYKTDRVSERALKALYEGQLALYADCWMQMFPGRGVRAALWSTAFHREFDLAF